MRSEAEVVAKAKVPRRSNEAECKEVPKEYYFFPRMHTKGKYDTVFMSVRRFQG